MIESLVCLLGRQSQSSQITTAERSAICFVRILTAKVIWNLSADSSGVQVNALLRAGAARKLLDLLRESTAEPELFESCSENVNDEPFWEDAVEAAAASVYNLLITGGKWLSALLELEVIEVLICYILSCWDSADKYAVKALQALARHGARGDPVISKLREPTVFAALADMAGRQSMTRRRYHAMVTLWLVADGRDESSAALKAAGAAGWFVLEARSYDAARVAAALEALGRSACAGGHAARAVLAEPGGMEALLHLLQGVLAAGMEAAGDGREGSTGLDESISLEAEDEKGSHCDNEGSHVSADKNGTGDNESQCEEDEYSSSRKSGYSSSGSEDSGSESEYGDSGDQGSRCEHEGCGDPCLRIAWRAKAASALCSLSAEANPAFDSALLRSGAIGVLVALLRESNHQPEEQSHEEEAALAGTVTTLLNLARRGGRMAEALRAAGAEGPLRALAERGPEARPGPEEAAAEAQQGLAAAAEAAVRAIEGTVPGVP